MISQEEYNDLRKHWEFEQGPKEFSWDVIGMSLLLILAMVLGGFLGACVTKSYYHSFVKENPELKTIQIEQAERQLQDLERKIEMLKGVDAERDH